MGSTLSGTVIGYYHCIWAFIRYRYHLYTTNCIITLLLIQSCIPPSNLLLVALGTMPPLSALQHIDAIGEGIVSATEVHDTALDSTNIVDPLIARFPTHRATSVTLIYLKFWQN